MDHMSNFPAPSKNECASEIVDSIYQSANHGYSLSLKYKITESEMKYIKSLSREDLLNKCNEYLNPIPHDDFGSYTGWYVAGQSQFTESFIKTVVSLKARIQARRKIIQLKIRAIGIFMILFKNTLETLYAPGSAYERSLKHKYKHFFKQESKTFTPSDDDDNGYFIAPHPPSQPRKHNAPPRPPINYT